MRESCLLSGLSNQIVDSISISHTTGQTASYSILSRWVVCCKIVTEIVHLNRRSLLWICDLFLQTLAYWKFLSLQKHSIILICILHVDETVNVIFIISNRNLFQDKKLLLLLSELRYRSRQGMPFTFFSLITTQNLTIS